MFRDHHSLETLLIQNSWVPQHVFSTLYILSSCLMTIVIVPDLNINYRSINYFILNSILISSGFGSSIYVGGFVFILISVFLFICQTVKYKKYNIILYWIMLAILCIILCTPFLLNYMQVSSAKTGSAVSIQIWMSLLTDNLLLNIISYFTISALSYFGVIFVAYLFVLVKVKFEYKSEFICISLASFIMPLFLASVISNNDLGWRTVLPFVVILSSCTPFFYFYFEKKYLCLIFFISGIQFSNSFNYLKDSFNGLQSLKVDKSFEQSVIEIEQITKKRSRLMMNTLINGNYDGRNYLIPIVIARKFSYVNWGCAVAYGENTPFNDVNFVESKISNLFYKGIIPELNFFKILKVDYLIVLKDDPIFTNDIETDFLKQIFKSNNTKIYKIVY